MRWSFQIGSNAGYDCTDQVVAAWAGNTIYILDQNGKSSYNDNLGEPSSLPGRESSMWPPSSETPPPSAGGEGPYRGPYGRGGGRLPGFDPAGCGLYGKNGEYMWTLSLDVFGTAANYLLNTFEVGKMNTGEVSLGDSCTYAVLYENSKLRVIGTRKMLSFNYGAPRTRPKARWYTAGGSSAAKSPSGGRADDLRPHLPDGQPV